MKGSRPLSFVSFWLSFSKIDTPCISFIVKLISYEKCNRDLKAKKFYLIGYGYVSWISFLG